MASSNTEDNSGEEEPMSTGCPIHQNDLPCRMCESELATNGAVMTRFYRKFGKVVMDVADGKITGVRYCQFGSQVDLIGHAPHEFAAAW